jgi:hypothetical protein
MRTFTTPKITMKRTSSWKRYACVYFTGAFPFFFAISRPHVQDDGLPIESATPDLTPQEVRRIVNIVKFWASTSHLDDMASSCRLLSRKHGVIFNAIMEIVAAARSSLTNKPFAKKGVTDALYYYYTVTDS